MNFWKQNSSMIIRLIITHIGMAAFGTVLFLSTIQMGDGIRLAAGIFSAVFYAVIVYTTMWEYGFKDKSAIDAGRLQSGAGRGFLVSLTAESVSIILVLAYLVSSFFGESNAITAQISFVSYCILILLDSCFTGIMLFVHDRIASEFAIAIVFLLGSLFISACSAFGYAAGTRELHIFPKKNTAKK